jgi:hypothetical protein
VLTAFVSQHRAWGIPSVLYTSLQLGAVPDEVAHPSIAAPVAASVADVAESEDKSDSKRPDRSNLPPLPEGWEEFSDEEGDVRCSELPKCVFWCGDPAGLALQYYYVNKSTGESSWERPGVITGLGIEGELPEGWKAYQDAVGDVRCLFARVFGFQERCQVLWFRCTHRRRIT